MLVEKLTPEVLVSCPRRSPAVPSHDGSLALYNQETYEPGVAIRHEIRVINIETSNSWVAVSDNDAYDAVWLEEDGRHCIVYLKGGELGMTWLMFKDVDRLSDAAVVLGPIPGYVRGLKLKRLRDDSIGLAVIGLANSEGSLYNPELERMPSHSAQVFDSCQVRDWNSQTTAQRLAIWYSSIERDGAYWSLAQPLSNMMRKTNLDLAVDNDSIDSSHLSAYDLSERGIVFAAYKLSQQNSMSHSAAAAIFYAPVYSYAGERDLDILELKVHTAKLGSCSQPKFNKDGTMIGFIHAPAQHPEDRKIYLKHVHEPSLNAISVAEMVTGHSDQWQASLVDFSFTPNGHSMYITARECGRISLFKLDLQPHASPRLLLPPSHGSCHAVYPVHANDNERALVSTSSFVESSLYQVVLVDGHDVEPVSISSLSRHGAGLGLSPNQVSELYFEGGGDSRGGDYFCHAHVVKPREFDSKRRKFPVAILIHDGPIAAWDNAWDNQWNAAVWAEQGYIVVLPNISGSTGFGLDFASSVRNNWGGRPLDDILNLFQHLRQVPGTDMDNAVIAGAGYGGYLMNWIQGHEVGRKFKAIVSHAGIFDIPSYALTSRRQDHGPFSLHFGHFTAPIRIEDPILPGTFPDAAWISQNSDATQTQYNPEGLERYNPSRPDLIFPPTYGQESGKQTWSTPMLLLHGEQDHHVPVAQSLAAFRVCQSRHQLDTATARQAGVNSNNGTGLRRYKTTANSRGKSVIGNSHTRHMSMLSFPPQYEPEAGLSRSTSLDLHPVPQRVHYHHDYNHQQRQQGHQNYPPRPRSRLVLFPDEGHIIKKPKNQLEWYRQVFAWTNHWTGITARHAFQQQAHFGSTTVLTAASTLPAIPLSPSAVGNRDGVAVPRQEQHLLGGGDLIGPSDLGVRCTGISDENARDAAQHGSDNNDVAAVPRGTSSSPSPSRPPPSDSGGRGRVVFAGISNLGRQSGEWTSVAAVSGGEGQRSDTVRPVSMVAFATSSHVLR